MFTSEFQLRLLFLPVLQLLQMQLLHLQVTQLLEQTTFMSSSCWNWCKELGPVRYIYQQNIHKYHRCHRVT